MKQSKRIFLVVGSVLILSSTQALFSIEKLFSPIAFFVGVNTVLITIALAHIERKNSAKLFSAYLGLFLLAYMILDYLSNGEVKLLFFTYERPLAIILRSIIYLYLVGFVAFGVIWQGNFLQLKGKIAFKIAVILLACFLLIELPIYDIHGDFGGHSHGHPLWEGFHFH
jgi:hypothetical protein